MGRLFITIVMSSFLCCAPILCGASETDWAITGDGGDKTITHTCEGAGNDIVEIAAYQQWTFGLVDVSISCRNDRTNRLMFTGNPDWNSVKTIGLFGMVKKVPQGNAAISEACPDELRPVGFRAKYEYNHDSGDEGLVDWSTLCGWPYGSRTDVYVSPALTGNPKGYWATFGSDRCPPDETLHGLYVVEDFGKGVIGMKGICGRN